MFDLKRQGMLLILLFAAFLTFSQAHAKDGDSGGGSGGSGGGSENSGSGGGGGDDDDGDDDDNDDDEDDDSDRGSKDHERALNALKKGKVVSLQKLKTHLKANYPGKILRVDLKRQSGTYYYKVRVLAPGNRIRAFTLNALTLKLRSS